MVGGYNLASFAAFSLVNVQWTDYVPIFISSYVATCKIFASSIANFALYSQKFSTCCDTSIEQEAIFYLLCCRVHENTYLCSVIENHLKDGPWNHRLRQFCNESLDSLKFFIRKYPKGPRSPYRKLNIKAPILEQLANLVILEYPVIHVFLPSHTCDFEVINDMIPNNVELKKTVDADYPSPKGVTLREEEFEDGGSPNPLFSDLMNHSNQNMVAQTEFKESIFSPLVVRGDEQDKSVLTSGGSVWKEEEYYICKDLGIPEGEMNFDFEQGLVDVYSDLIKGTNPDDFLMEEGEIA